MQRASECRGCASHRPAWGFPPRLRLVAPLEQLPFDLRPARRENSRQLLDGDPVNAGCPLVAGPDRCFHVIRCTDLLHESFAHCRAFGAGHRPDHFSLSRGGASPRSGTGNSSWYGGCAVLMRRPIYSPFPSTPFGDRSGLQPVARPTTPSADFCTALREPCDALSPDGHGADLLG